MGIIVISGDIAIAEQNIQNKKAIPQRQRIKSAKKLPKKKSCKTWFCA